VTHVDLAQSETWIIAHRGASKQSPENSFAAFDAAIAQHSDAIELDVQLSRDGVPVVYHDRTLSRAGGGRRRVANLDLVELQGLHAASSGGPDAAPQPIPTLAEVLQNYAGRTRLLLEIKTRGGRQEAARHIELTRKAAELAERHRSGSDVMLLCYEKSVLAESARVAPDLPRVLNLKPPPVLGSALKKELAALHALSVDVRTLTSLFANAVRRAQCPLFVFTCNTPRKVRQALRANAAGIMSDRPLWLHGLLGRSGAS
jgi:glycerophosphoryl diester phosphodiesterase